MRLNSFLCFSHGASGHMTVIARGLEQYDSIVMKVPIKIDVMNKQRHEILNDFMHHCTLDQYFTNQH